jgi:HK97 family phage major capsid protein
LLLKEQKVASDVAKSLFEQEQSLFADIKGMSKTAADEKRDFNADEKIRWNNLHNELDQVDGRLKTVLEDEKREHQTNEAYNEFSKRMPSGPVASAQGNAFADSVRAFARGETRSLDIQSGGRIMDRMKQGRPVNPAEARALYDNYVSNVASGGTGAPGSLATNVNSGQGGIVPVDFYDQLISYLVEVSGVMQTGPTVLNTQGGEPIQVPVVSQHAGYSAPNTLAANLTASQGSVLNSADPGFTQKTLSSNKFGIMIQVSRELIDDSGVNLLSYLAMSAGRSIGNAVGNAILNGTGGVTGGLVPNVGVVVTGGTAASMSGSYGNAAPVGAPTYGNLVDLEYSVIAPYRQSRSCYWLAADKTLGALRKLTDLQGRPVWEPSTVLGAPDLLLGKPLVADPYMASLGLTAGANKTILFGDFAQFFVRLVGGVRFERSDDFAFSQDLVSFRAIVRADSNLMTATSAPPPIVAFQSNTA